MGGRNESTNAMSHSPTEAFLSMNVFQPKCVARLRRRLCQQEQLFIIIEADHHNKNKIFDMIRNSQTNSCLLSNSPMYICVIREETAHEYMNHVFTHIHNTLHSERSSSYTIVCLGVFPMDKTFINESIQEVSNQTFKCYDTDTISMNEMSQWVQITPVKKDELCESVELDYDEEPEGIMFHTGPGYIECFDMS